MAYYATIIIRNPPQNPILIIKALHEAYWVFWGTLSDLVWAGKPEAKPGPLSKSHDLENSGFRVEGASATWRFMGFLKFIK